MVCVLGSSQSECDVVVIRSESCVIFYEGVRICCVDLQDTCDAKIVDSIDTNFFVQ